jgi:hypothetical protein
MGNTIQVRIHKDLAKIILNVRGELIKKNKTATLGQITKKMSKLLNMRDLIN